MSSIHASPLRYPGGKAALTSFLADSIRLNNLVGGHYVEPFAGGSGAALHLLFSHLVGSIHINDKDPCIYNFWRAVCEETERFVRLIWDARVTVDEWRRQKVILKSPSDHSPFEIGFATFFVNRCSHSGVLNGGPIGGYEQASKYKVDARFYRRELVRRIEKIGLYRSRIHLSNHDGIEFLRGLFKGAYSNVRQTLVYMDPPYFLKGQRLYSFFFKDADHEALADFLLREQESPVRWILSGDRTTLIRKLYPGKLREIRLNYCVHSVKVGRELIISSKNCTVPRRLSKFRSSRASLKLALCHSLP